MQRRNRRGQFKRRVDWVVIFRRFKKFLVVIGMFILIELSLDLNKSIQDFSKAFASMQGSDEVHTLVKEKNVQVNIVDVTEKLKKGEINAREYAQAVVTSKWGLSEWDSMDQLIQHESGWQVGIFNHGCEKQYGKNIQVCACGIGQAMPCHKMTDLGYQLNSAKDEVDWAILYIQTHPGYGTPSKAWAAWQDHQKNGWVDSFGKKEYSGWY